VPALFGKVLRNPQLLRLDLGIFCLHLVLTALFLAVPLELVEAGLAVERHAWLYLPVMLGGMGLMVPFVIKAEKGGKMKEVFLGAVGLLGLAQIGLYAMEGSLWGLGLALLAFFTAFNLLEATLPSLVSKLAPGAIRGTAMGVYSTSQFTGAFMGGLTGGWVHQHYGTTMVFVTSAIVTLIWLLAAQGMEVPEKG
jgi:Major Facilitator Superfamily.